MRNSWGTHWGIDGFFKVCRGVDNLAIESKGAWAVPENTWSPVQVNHTTTQAELDNSTNDKTVYQFP